MALRTQNYLSFICEPICQPLQNSLEAEAWELLSREVAIGGCSVNKQVALSAALLTSGKPKHIARSFNGAKGERQDEGGALEW